MPYMAYIYVCQAYFLQCTLYNMPFILGTGMQLGKQGSVEGRFPTWRVQECTQRLMNQGRIALDQFKLALADQERHPTAGPWKVCAYDPHCISAPIMDCNSIEPSTDWDG